MNAKLISRNLRRARRWSRAFTYARRRIVAANTTATAAKRGHAMLRDGANWRTVRTEG